jgi:hypothetical protein
MSCGSREHQTSARSEHELLQTHGTFPDATIMSYAGSDNGVKVSRWKLSSGLGFVGDIIALKLAESRNALSTAFAFLATATADDPTMSTSGPISPKHVSSVSSRADDPAAPYQRRRINGRVRARPTQASSPELPRAVHPQAHHAPA